MLDWDTEGTEVREGTENYCADLSQKIIGCAIEVHRQLGPGMLESAYEQCLCHELELAGLRFEHQKSVPIKYKALTIPTAYRIDLLVEEQVVVELKSIEDIRDVHRAQLLSYMRLAGYRVGLLINFNTRLLKDGIRRIVL